MLEVVIPATLPRPAPAAHLPRNNRRSQSDFSRQVCGFQELADHVGRCHDAPQRPGSTGRMNVAYGLEARTDFRECQDKSHTL